MKKSSVTIFALLAMLSSLAFMISSANAWNLSVQWGHLNPGSYDPDERTLEADVCDYIYWQFYDDWYTGCDPLNLYWQYTSNSQVSTFINYQNQYADYVTNWWVGDFLPGVQGPGPFGHIWFYGEGTNIVDSDLYRYTTSYGTIASKQYFDFIWTCNCGGMYWYNDQGSYNVIDAITDEATSYWYPGPTNTNTKYGFVYNNGDRFGMPLAWTGQSSLNSNGDYCYIGFEGPSPFMQYTFPGAYSRTDTFPEAFYFKALGNDEPYHLHQPINTALDYAAEQTFGYQFEDCRFSDGYWMYTTQPVVGWWFSHMRVYGNGWSVLPY